MAPPRENTHFWQLGYDDALAGLPARFIAGRTDQLAYHAGRVDGEAARLQRLKQQAPVNGKNGQEA